MKKKQIENNIMIKNWNNNENFHQNSNDIPLTDEEINQMMEIIDEKKEIVDNEKKVNNNKLNKMNVEEEILNLKKEVNSIKIYINEIKNLIYQIYNIVICLQKLKEIRVNKNTDENNLLNVLDDIKNVLKDNNNSVNNEKLNLEKKSKLDNNDNLDNISNKEELYLDNQNIESSNESENIKQKYNYKHKTAKNYLFQFEDENKMKFIFEKFKSNKEILYMKMVSTHNLFGKINLFLVMNFKNRYKMNINSIFGGLYIEYFKRLQLEDEINNGTIIDEYKAEEN